MKLNDKQIFCFKFAYILLIFVFLLGSWTYWHEMIHLYTCRTLGHTATISLDNYSASTNCPDIEKSKVVGVYYYLLMPYLVDYVILTILFFVLRMGVKDLFLKILPYVLIFDIVGNYLSSFSGVGDFFKLQKLIGNYGYIFLLMPLMALFLTFFFLRKDIKNLKRK